MAAPASRPSARFAAGGVRIEGSGEESGRRRRLLETSLYSLVFCAKSNAIVSGWRTRTPTRNTMRARRGETISLSLEF